MCPCPPSKFLPLAQCELHWYGTPNPLFDGTILENTVRQVTVRVPQSLRADVQYAIPFDQFFDAEYSNYKHANFGLRLKAWINANLKNFFKPFNTSDGPFAMLMTFTCRFESNSIDVWTKPSVLLPTNFLPDAHAVARLTNLITPHHMSYDPRGLLEPMNTINYVLEPVNTDHVQKFVTPWTRAPYVDTDPEYLDKLEYSSLLDKPEAPPADDGHEAVSPRLSLSYDEAEDLPLPAPKKLCIGISSQMPETTI